MERACISLPEDETKGRNPPKWATKWALLQAKEIALLHHILCDWLYKY